MKRVDPDSVSPQLLAEAFLAIQEKLKPRALQAIEHLYYSPNHAVHDDGMGQFSEIVMMFGRIGGLLSKQLDMEPSRGYKLLWLAYQEIDQSSESVIWKMRGNFCKALEIAGWPRASQEDDDPFYADVMRSLRDTHETRQERLASAPKVPARYTATVTLIKRNPDVVAEILHRANGQCEHCKSQAPFRRAIDGTPYLEVHHKMRLADGGEDTPENAIALCPNCHRRMHYA